MKLDLKLIAAQLEGLEETIIAKLIDRAQFCVNDLIYQAGKSGFDNEKERSLFELRLFYQESMDSQFGRFYVPEERPFNKDLPAPAREIKLPSTGLKIKEFNQINLTSEIKDSYLKLIQRLCPKGDDSQYGSSVEHDIYSLQAISRRIHFGSMYVAECKFMDDPQGYSGLIDEGDKNGLMNKLTREEVELKIISRIKNKVDAFQAKANPAVRNLIDPEIIMDYYRDTVIPLTKKGEIIYLTVREK